MTSGPTQNYEDPHLGRWRPHPVLAALVRAAAIVLPVVLALAFGLAAAHWLPASRLGVNRWVWVSCEVVLSLLVLRGATHLAKRLVPLGGLLTLTGNFTEVDLTDARLDNATLTGIDLTDADLDSASFVNATITSSNLTHVSLKDANLTGATIRGSVLDKATIERSTFDGAVVTDTTFLNAKITKSTAVLALFTRDSFVGAEVKDGFLAPASVTDCTF